MALSNLLPGWLGRNQPHDVEDSYGQASSRTSDLVRPATMASEAWAWGYPADPTYCQMANSLEPPAFIPVPADHPLLIDDMDVSFEATSPGMASDPAGDVHMGGFTESVNCAPMIDPVLLGAVNPAPAGAAPSQERFLSAQHCGSPEQIPYQPATFTAQEDHGAMEMYGNCPVVAVAGTQATQPVGGHMHRVMHRLVDRSSPDETGLPSPGRPATPGKILPGVYDIFGQPTPRDLVPRAGGLPAPPSPPPARRGNKYATHLQPWGCSKCNTAFMTPHLLQVHKRFHSPQPPMYKFQNAAFQVRPCSEENLRRTSEQNQRHSFRLRCENGKWTSYSQLMHGFGDAFGDGEDVENVIGGRIG